MRIEKIEVQKPRFIEENIYGDAEIARVLIYVKNWMSESGTMDYIHPVIITNRMESSCVFKTDTQKVIVKIDSLDVLATIEEY